MSTIQRRIPVSVFAFIAVVWVWTSLAQAQVGTLRPTLDLTTVDGMTVPFQSGAPLPDFEPQDRPRLELAGSWKRERVALDDHYLSFENRTDSVIAQLETEGGGRHQSDYDDGDWPAVTLPAVEDVMPGVESSSPEPYHGGLWFRRTVDIPADWTGRANRLVFLASSYITDVWINGEWVAVHEGGYTPFSVDVSNALVYGEPNVIAVRVDHPFPGSRSGMVPSWFLADWWDYAGIIQDFYLESSPAVHIVRSDVIPMDYNGTVRVNVVAQNASGANAAVRVELRAFHADAESEAFRNNPAPSSIVGAEASVEGCPEANWYLKAGEVQARSFVFRVRDPQRWTPRDPNLYVLRTTLADAGESVDIHHTQFGIRVVERADAKMKLNGRTAFLPGVARHEEWLDTGRTATWDRIREDLEIARDLNSLFLRSGHYPNHPYTYLLTDRLGLTVMAEIPVYWSFFWNWKVQRVRDTALQMFRELVFSNYNRPSILLWGTNNEPFYFFNGGLGAYDREIHEDHDLYDDGRMITQSLAAGATWGNTAPSNQWTDVAGWTLYYGVFYGDDPLEDTRDFLNDFNDRFPEHPVIATEYGIWSEADDSQEADQLEVFNQTWAAFAELGALDADGNENPDGLIAAASWWCQYNWFTKNGLPDFIAPFLNSMGVIHADRMEWKDTAFAMAEAYEPYFDYGGLGSEPGDYVVEDSGAPGNDCPADDDDDDDDDIDDDVADDDDSTPGGTEADGGTGGCGC